MDHFIDDSTAAADPVADVIAITSLNGLTKIAADLVDSWINYPEA